MASTLQDAEGEALRQTEAHADFADGQSILELDCGWGSLSPFMARQFPHANIVVVSDSSSQRKYIETETAKCSLTNLRVITADINAFDATVLRKVYGNETQLWMRRWRWLLLATAGLFADGDEWGVSHYRMRVS